MKRFIAWLCSIVLIVSVCGCQSETPAEEPATTPMPTPTPSQSESEPPETEPLYEEALIPQETWAAAKAFAGGTGTVEDPFQIATAEQLALMAQLINSGASISEEDSQESSEAESSDKQEGSESSCVR